MDGARRWLLRVHTMWLATWHTAQTLVRNMNDIYRQDGMAGGAVWRRTLGWFFVRPGLLRRILPAYLGYYLPGFHPWRRDDRPLLARAKAALAI
jgi:uncharacterized protein